MSVWSPDWASNVLKKKFWELFQISFDKMVLILISIIQHEQYYLIILFINRPKGWNFIEKETLAQMFSCEFCEISRNNFFYRAHPGNWFWIKFCKSYKEVCEGTSLVKFWQSCHFDIKWRKNLLKRKILNKVAGRKHMFFWCKFCEILRTPFLQKTSDWLITKDAH